MSKSIIIAVVASAAMIAAGVISPFVIRDRRTESLRGVCWAQDTQNQFKTIAIGILEDEISAASKAQGSSGLSDGEVSRGLNFKASNFHVIGIDEAAASSHCGAEIGFGFRMPNGRALRNASSVVDFEVHPAAGGSTVTSVAHPEAWRQIVLSATAVDESH